MYICTYSKFHRGSKLSERPGSVEEELDLGVRLNRRRNHVGCAWNASQRRRRRRRREFSLERHREKKGILFFLLNFTKGAPMTLTIAIPVCVPCEMGNGRQTSTMSFQYFSSSSLPPPFLFSLFEFHYAVLYSIGARRIQNLVAS